MRNIHAAIIKPTSVPSFLLPERLSRAARDLQWHECNGYCLIRQMSVQQCRAAGYDPASTPSTALTAQQKQVFFRCSKNFPKKVAQSKENQLRADPRVEFTGVVHYNPPRDCGYVNNYNPIMLHAWAANMDQQILHPEGKLKTDFRS